MKKVILVFFIIIFISNIQINSADNLNTINGNYNPYLNNLLTDSNNKLKDKYLTQYLISLTQHKAFSDTIVYGYKESFRNYEELYSENKLTEIEFLYKLADFFFNNSIDYAEYFYEIVKEQNPEFKKEIIINKLLKILMSKYGDVLKTESETDDYKDYFKQEFKKKCLNYISNDTEPIRSQTILLYCNSNSIIDYGQGPKLDMALNDIELALKYLPLIDSDYKIELQKILLNNMLFCNEQNIYYREDCSVCLEEITTDLLKTFPELYHDKLKTILFTCYYKIKDSNKMKEIFLSIKDKKYIYKLYDGFYESKEFEEKVLNLKFFN